MMRNVFTGYYNGFNVEVKSAEEMTLLYNMGCFGKGSASRSKPLANGSTVNIMRKRQFLKRNYWYKKFGKEDAEIDMFLKEVDEVTANIAADGEKHSNRDVIDLVSSDENMSDDYDEDNHNDNNKSFQTHEKEEMVVVVPNSDSEEDNYFAKMKPKCCYNRIKLQENLVLAPEEAFFLVYGFGCLQIINIDKILDIEETWDLFSSVDKNFIPKYVVYHYFRSKGYVVKPGIKFGGDYLIYKEGPEKTHAEYVVVVKEEDNSQIFDPIFTLGHMRMVHTTMKTLMIAEVKLPKQAVKMPEDLNKYSVQERILTRFNPLGLNDHNENFNTFI